MDKILLHDAGQIFDAEPKLIELPSYGRAVFVGDTHGDLDATKAVLGRYLHHDNNILVFLGDYVDRGDHSRENVDVLLEFKVSNPNRIYMLMGNHEGWKFQDFYPCDFWDSLSQKDTEEYENLFSKLPFAASCSGIIALHGAPPDLNTARDKDVNTLRDINAIKPKSEQWYQITWGDLMNAEKENAYSEGTVRQKFGARYFARVMDDLHKEILIRSHQPDAPTVMLNDRCLTIFTSNAYHSSCRTIAIADLSKETFSVDGLEVREV